MPAKKLTARKRAELKQKKLKQQQKKSNLFTYVILAIIFIAVIAGVYYIVINNGSDGNNQNTNGQVTNTAPTANMDYIIVPINSYHYRITPLKNDVDKETPNELNITSVTTPSYGTSEIVTGDLIIYIPERNFTGTDSFEYTVSDGEKKSKSIINIYISNEYPLAIIDTSMGTIIAELYIQKALITVGNFIDLANEGFYNNTVFHRVIDNFMIQGGGFNADGTYKESPYGPIDLEIDPDLHHVDGAIAMARTSDPNSATSQFFIDDGAQPQLEPGGVDDYGYAVFGAVIDGMNVVRTIASLQTTTKYGMQDWPIDDVIINSISVPNVFKEIGG